MINCKCCCQNFVSNSRCYLDYCKLRSWWCWYGWQCQCYRSWASCWLRTLSCCHHWKIWDSCRDQWTLASSSWVRGQCLQSQTSHKNHWTQSPCPPHRTPASHSCCCRWWCWSRSSPPPSPCQWPRSCVSWWSWSGWRWWGQGWGPWQPPWQWWSLWWRQSCWHWDWQCVESDHDHCPGEGGSDQSHVQLLIESMKTTLFSKTSNHILCTPCL